MDGMTLDESGRADLPSLTRLGLTIDQKKRVQHMFE